MRWVIGLLLILGFVGDAHAQWVELDPPRSLTVVLLSGERYRGRMTGYDQSLFHLQLTDDEEVQVHWADLPPDKVLTIHRVLLREAEAESWLRLGAMLYQMPQGEPSMEKALRRALSMDASLDQRAEAIRTGEPYEPPELVEPEQAEEAAEQGLAGVLGPVLTGGLQARYWGPQSPAVMDASVAELKTYAQDIGQQLGVPLHLRETEYFLLYTDLPTSESRNWAGLLDRMYRRLSRLFEIEGGDNLFRGKCLILIFQDQETYFRYHGQMYGFDARQTTGLCRMFGDGYVKVSFFRQPNEHDFAYILVHETVHGFLFRYESPSMIPSWINEGLAELIASEMVEGSRLDDARWSGSTWPILRNYHSLNGMMWADHIAGWQYGAAQRITEFMVRQDRERYRAFIAGIKEGLTWKQSLTARYGSTVERLVSIWGESIGVPDLRP